MFWKIWDLPHSKTFCLFSHFLSAAAPQETIKVPEISSIIKFKLHLIMY